MPVFEIAMLVDARGMTSRRATERTAQCLRSVGSGDVLEVLASDPQTVLEFPDWAAATGHDVLGFTSNGSTYTFVIRRGRANASTAA